MTQTTERQEKWRQATRGNPCPICGANHYCSTSPDGAVALCMKEPAGAFKTKDTAVGTGYFHRLHEDHSQPSDYQPKDPNHASRDKLIAQIARQANGVFITAWPYHNAAGALVFEVCRFNQPGGDKTFRPIHPQHDGQWRQGDPPLDKLPLYRLPHLNGQGRVYLVEGEKATDAAVTLGLTTTTSAHGAGGVDKTDWTPLAGREIVLLPDHDDAGNDYADRVTRRLVEIDPSTAIRVVHLPDLPPKGDIVEYISTHEDAEPEALRATIEAMSDQATPVDSASAGGLMVQTAAEITTEPVTWLWHHKIVGGAINLICGQPDVGKSVLTMDIAARVTKGTEWPLGDVRDNRAGSVAILSVEDSPAATIVPRLEAAGAELSKAFIVHGVKRPTDDGHDAVKDGFDLGRDVGRLLALYRTHPDLRLVILDPLDSYIGGIDSARGNEARTALWPIKDFAEQTGVTVIIAHHWNKGVSTNALDRVSGSRSFGAMPRAVWAVAKDDDDLDRAVMVPVKLNLCRNPAGMAFAIKPSMENPEIPVIAWSAEEVTETANQLLGATGGTKRDEAVEFLEEILADGPRPMKDVQKMAKEAGLAWTTVQRAKDHAKVKSTPVRRHDNTYQGWEWAIPR